MLDQFSNDTCVSDKPNKQKAIAFADAVMDLLCNSSNFAAGNNTSTGAATAVALQPDVNFGAPTSTTTITTPQCPVQNMSLMRMPEGQLMLYWQAAGSSSPGKPKHFKNQAEFDKWWKFILQNSPNMNSCTNPLTSPAVCGSTSTARTNLAVRHQDPSHQAALNKTQAIALTDPPVTQPSSVSTVSDTRLQQAMSDIAALKAQIGSTPQTGLEVQTTTTDIVKSKSNKGRASGSAATAASTASTYGFVYMPADQWQTNSRPPVCLTEQHCPVCPLYPRETPVGLMDLPMWSRADIETKAQQNVSPPIPMPNSAEVPGGEPQAYNS